MVETENNRGSESRRALLFYYGVVLLWLEVWHIRAEDTERRLCVLGPFREPYRGRGQPFQPGRCERRSPGIERGQKRLSTIASREWIEDNTKVTIPANKRNYRKQEAHLYLARRKKEDMKVIGEVVKEGRPTAERTVREWQESHPAGKKADCIRETGLAKHTVYKWWK